MNYNFVINDFEGPLDLLLHLVKQSKMDIYEIKIEEIINQYLNFIKMQKNLNLDVSSEFLVMASELIEIKSKLLLPNKKLEDEEDIEEAKEKLINRLLEYKKYKEMLDTFKKMESSRNELFTREPMNLKEFKNNDVTEDEVSLEDLLNALNNFLMRKEYEKPRTTKITKKELSVSERSNDIRKILAKKKKISFFDLFTIKTKEYVVVTFLSILEMAKFGELDIVQNNNFNEIIINMRGEKNA